MDFSATTQSILAALCAIPTWFTCCTLRNPPESPHEVINERVYDHETDGLYSRHHGHQVIHIVYRIERKE
jgi:hypothetical protein